MQRARNSMEIKFKDLEKAQQLFNEHGHSAEEIEKEMNRLWEANNMREQLHKAELGLLCYGKAEITITNFKDK